MRYEFKPSFDKSIKTLSSEIKQEIKELCIHLIDVLSGERDLSVGLGLKNLKKNFWEIRKGLKLRILFRWRSDYVEFILAGTHDDIKRFLKR
jgi:mRNA-degrading endonuclease RelE of RelBE toxin-antitoxin system